MNSFTRVGLPIVLVAGLAFGITFIRMYSPEDESASVPSGGDPKQTIRRELPLKFFTTRAAVSSPDSTPKHLWYWDANIEVGAASHYEFWCQNRHQQPVSVRVHSTNCQCAGVEMAVVPPDAYQNYLLQSALAGSPLCPASAPLAAMAHLQFGQRLTWEMLHQADAKSDRIIPAADPVAGPQFALVRLGWTGKGEVGPKEIAANLFASIGDQLPAQTELGAATQVVPAFDIYRRDGRNWVSTRDVHVGELRENGYARQTVYLASTTRSHFLYSIVSDRPDPCISWSSATPATAEEIGSLSEHLRGQENALKRVKSLYKVDFDVHERMERTVGMRKELCQLDLGPVDRRLTVTAAGAGAWMMTLRGRVLGDIAVLGGSDGERIELGNSFTADQDRTKSLNLLADRPGLDLALLENETMPNYLKVKLEALKETADGRKQWRLTVTVPKGSLYGALPESSAIVLKTSGPTSRRLRLPVRGMTFDSGGPRL
jgi:hypothetical protein